MSSQLGLLPQWELYLYLILSFGFHFYSFYEVFQVSQENEEELDREFELETDMLFWGFKKEACQEQNENGIGDEENEAIQMHTLILYKVMSWLHYNQVEQLLQKTALDPMDFEWSFWMEWGKGYVLWLLCGHLVVSQMSSLCMEKHRPCFWMAYGMAASWFLLGTNGLIVILVHVTVSYLVALFKNPILVWLSSLLLLSTLHVPALEEVKRSWYASESEYYLLLFTLTVRCLYYTSFSLEYCWHRPTETAQHSFLWMLVYVFYYPVFHNGPIITFDDFCKQVTKQESCSLKANFCVFIWGTIRILLWWWLAEWMIHLMYMHAICSSPSHLEAVTYWTLGGLALAQVLFFYVKYLVLFGIPALVIRMDGFQPPALPRCVSTMYSFSGMWRNFDVGLHRFLIRYIYIPMGGSHSSIFKMLSSTAITFAFVSYWHGGHSYLWSWAFLNWIGVTAENGARRLISLPTVHNFINHCLSPRGCRRLHAALASISTTWLIFSNLVFLGGNHVGRIYWNRIFIAESTSSSQTVDRHPPEGCNLMFGDCETDKLIADKENALSPMESQTEPHMPVYS